MNKYRLIFPFVWAMLTWASHLYSFENAERHVMMIHVDGLHSDVLQHMLKLEQLPHFRFFKDRGKSNFRTSTVDKSETMKVVLSYLTSHSDVKIGGWWQFERKSFNFNNTWMDPEGVISYATGVRYPEWPTIIDFLKDQNKMTVGGFSLHRRNVRFEDFSRNYFEGLLGAFHHDYYKQVQETLSSFERMFVEHIKAGLPVPALSTLVLAAVDEMTHLNGVTTDRIDAPQDEDFISYCLHRGDANFTDGHESILAMLNDSKLAPYIYLNEGIYPSKFGMKRQDGHFTHVQRSYNDEAIGFCYRLPVIAVPDARQVFIRKVVHPETALAMLIVDIQLGRLIDFMRSVLLNCTAEGNACVRDFPKKGLRNIAASDYEMNTLFNNMLFMIFGDHGMVDSKKMMNSCSGAECSAYERSSSSLNESFIETLNRRLNLQSPSPDSGLQGSELIGIDDTVQPLNIKCPHDIPSWQDGKTADFVAQARQKSETLYQHIGELLHHGFGKKYWYFGFLKNFFVFPKLESAMAAREPEVMPMLMQTWLRGQPDYVQAEKAYLASIYNRHVRLVYGGAARNHAELFLPIEKPSGFVWQGRPKFVDILAYRPAGPDSPILLDVLREIPGVDLIFIRINNDSFAGNQVPDSAQIMVMNQRGDQGIIGVRVDEGSLEKVYSYTKLTPDDPLMFKSMEAGIPVYGTYAEWNERSLRENQFYHNPVAGMGSYLFSINDSIGDILVMHKTGWNFGDNAGGHGGLHRQEKLTSLIVSHPSLTPGELTRTVSYSTIPVGPDVRVDARTWNANPTLLDLAPTALAWLGYPSGSLTAFSRSDAFKEQWRKWIRAQKQDLLSKVDELEDLDKISDMLGIPIHLAGLTGEMSEFLNFLPADIPEQLPNYEKEKEEGFILNLD